VLLTQKKPKNKSQSLNQLAQTVNQYIALQNGMESTDSVPFFYA